MTEVTVIKEFPFAKYYSDGSIEVFGNEEGYPRIKGVIPAPDINHSSEEEREQTHNATCNAITLQGYLITYRKRIRNMAFDSPAQKTTLSIRYRPCRNKEEIQQVYSKIRELIVDLKKVRP